MLMINLRRLLSNLLIYIFKVLKQTVASLKQTVASLKQTYPLFYLTNHHHIPNYRMVYMT